jgi:uncharacterized Zn ribbon protein
MATCPKCGYEWQSKATAAWITCPGCQRKFPRPEQVITILGPVVLESTAECRQCGRTVTEIAGCVVDGEPTFVCPECLRDLLE